MPSVRWMLTWAALAALAVLVLGGVPHPHDEVEGHGEHCVFCHAQDALFVAPGPPANPDPVERATDVPVAPAPVHGRTPTGGGPRAPPA
ncbi:MAG: hypothetical protein OXI65_07180 [Acidobacteriota bacterium]|nr:hypothetical protein [Acidobacteriota bacterium]